MHGTLTSEGGWRNLCDVSRRGGQGLRAVEVEMQLGHARTHIHSPPLPFGHTRPFNVSLSACGFTAPHPCHSFGPSLGRPLGTPGRPPPLLV